MPISSSRIPRLLRSAARKLLRHGDSRPAPANGSPEALFHADFYLRHNQRRQEHLASLGLPIAGRSVLELAAGIGDHTSFFLDRGCTVVSTEARPENLSMLRRRYPSLEVRELDLEDPFDLGRTFDIVYCYGALYHLQHPAEALAFMARCCRKLLLLETCVSFGEHEAINLVDEVAASPSESIFGRGCRPTRPWVFNRLKELFPHVYLSRSQPNHEEFPLDWTAAPPRAPLLIRSVFVASRQRLENPQLTEELLMHQLRQR
jgi:SAM-dependent methyltransferase